ncbi:MAG TPA: hypothetical protein VN039_03165 [Nitrospira sp.]|nr:hypothetical protein [Nitrospira sp.]
MAVEPKRDIMMIGSASAPILYFDNAPLYGVMGECVEVDLTSRVLNATEGNEVFSEAVCVGHLKCGVSAAQSLIIALSKALKLMGKEVPTEKPQSAFSDYVEGEMPDLPN